MNLFNGQTLRLTTKDNKIFEGFYSKKNNLNEEVVVGLDKSWIKLSEAANLEVIGRNIREDAKKVLQGFVDKLDGKELAKGITDKDKEVLENTATKLVGDDAKGNEEEIKDMFDSMLMSKQVQNTQDSTTNTLNNLFKQQESVDDVFDDESVDFNKNSDIDDVPDSYGMFAIDGSDVKEKMSEFYKTNTCREDLVEYYKFLTFNNNQEEAEKYVDDFLAEENGLKVNFSTDDLDNEIEDYINEVDEDEMSLNTLFEKTCEHFKLDLDQVSRIKESGPIGVESFEMLKECVAENRSKTIICTPKRFAESFTRKFREEEYSDTFTPEATLNSTLTDFVSPVDGEITLGTKDGEPVTNSNFDKFSDQLETELASKLSISPEDFATIVSYLSKYVKVDGEPISDQNDFEDNLDNNLDDDFEENDPTTNSEVLDPSALNDEFDQSYEDYASQYTDNTDSNDLDSAESKTSPVNVVDLSPEEIASQEPETTSEDNSDLLENGF